LSGFRAVLRTKEIGEAGTEIACFTYHRVGQSGKGRDLYSFSGPGLRLREDEFRSEVERNRRDDIVRFPAL
jgi:hypothetical protein